MKTKFTEPMREALIRYIEGGNTIETACKMVGVHKTQFYRWVKRGEDAREGTTFRKFHDDVQAAEARAEVRAMTILQQGMRDDPKWAAWYLERRLPQQYGRRQYTEQQTGPILVQLKWHEGADPLPPPATSEVSVMHQLPEGA